MFAPLENNKLLSSLSYLSVLFLPFLIPIIIYFVTKEKDVKYHAKRAFMSHLISILIAIFLSILFAIILFYTLGNALNTPLLILLFSLLILSLIVEIAIFIWNIMQAIKVVR